MSSSQTYDRSTNLQRGNACITCRRRKMRCDGTRPVCGQCDRGNRAEDCEYVEGNAPTPSQILEDNISRLEARILELQSPQNTEASVRLHQPYGGCSANAPSSDRGAASEPPLHIIQKMLDRFLPLAADFGFFLHVGRFRASISHPTPSGHPSRPAPSLLFAVYLWGIHLSGDPAVMANEGAYLNRAVHEATMNISGNHPQKVIHGIQADTLLANYFFAKGRFSEAKYYVTSAASTVIAAGLHKIRSRQASNLASSLPPARDPIEEGERIVGAWTVFILDKSWAATFKESSNLPLASDDRPTSWIDTPWPLDMTDYEQGRLPRDVRTDRTVLKFLNNEPTSDRGQSSLAIHGKASFLWEKATLLAHRWTSGMNTQHLSALSSEISAFDGILDGVRSVLPPLEQFANVPNSGKARSLVVCASVVHVAVIRLHNGLAQASEASRRKALGSAQAVLDIVVYVRSRNLTYLNPVIGNIWIEASQVIMNEISGLKSRRQSWAEPSEAEAQMLLGLQRGISAMSTFAPSSALLSFQVSRIQEAYSALTH